MTNLEIQRALNEMQSMAAQARGAKPAQPAEAQGASFADTLKDAVGAVNRQQLDAGAKTDALARGENIPLTDVMVSVNKSKVAFEAVKQVRNQLLEAYRDISRMQI